MDKTEYQNRMNEVLSRMNQFREQDGEAINSQGSNEPLTVFRVKRIVANQAGIDRQKILAEARAEGYSGTEHRLFDAIARLETRQEIQRKGDLYFIWAASPRSAGRGNRRGRT